MAQVKSSPGVFTNEIDQSFLPQGSPSVGAIVIGKASKGPAFLPVTVDGYPSFVSLFGDVDASMQLPYCAKNYLKNASTLTVVRVLGHSDGTSTEAGYGVDNITAITDASASGSVLAIIQASASVAVTGVGTGDPSSFVITIGSTSMTASFVSSSANYIEKVLNTDPTKYDTYGYFLSNNFKYSSVAASASWTAKTAIPNTFQRNFEGGYTQYVKSQPVGGIDYNLFRFATIGHGRATNDEIKVMIANVRPSPSPTATRYGTFDVVVRSFYDTDQRMQILETFSNCDLDPTSKNYVLRRIGDSYDTFDTTQRKFVSYGSFTSNSKYIRVELDSTSSPPPEALPWGHRGYDKFSFSDVTVVDDMPLVVDQLDSSRNIDSNICWGIMFASGGIADRMRAFPDDASTLAAAYPDDDFSLGFLSSSISNGKLVWSYNATLTGSALHQPLAASGSLYKFCMPFLGGHDGLDVRDSSALDPTYVDDETDIGVVSLKRAIDSVSDPDIFPADIVAIPSVINMKVTDYARTMANNRMDMIYIMDITGSSVAEAMGTCAARQIDDNYCACYYPDLKLNDKTNNKLVRVSPSVAMLGAYAYSDKVGQVFFAPAGLTRGGLGQFDIVGVYDNLSYNDRNTLYENRINPIASFPNEGIVAFGQKTMQVKASALDRINVRRLLIYAKRKVSEQAKYLVFEQNNFRTWESFVKGVNPFLDKIRQDQGIERFKVVMDSSTNTPDVIDRNEMKGKIFLQPTKAAEFVTIDFIITNAGVEFGQ